jgi:hypothetical protein
MLLVDDKSDTVMNIAEKSASGRPLYDHDLMQNGGHVTGYLMSEEQIDGVNAALGTLISAETSAPFLFAVGDGNHSLATAKTCFEELRALIGDGAAMKHPARYALVELVNLYDSSLEFEPIYRVLFGVDVMEAAREFESYAAAQDGKADAQTVTLIHGDKEISVAIPHPSSNLAVGSVQDFVGRYLKSHPTAAVDYIHGEETARALSAGDGALGFIFDGMSKDQLFATVIADGALPRKTFSMGHAHDKRFYTEARKILPD